MLGSNCGGITYASCADVEMLRTASSGFCIVANTEHCRSPNAAPVGSNQYLNARIFSYLKQTRNTFYIMTMGR